MAGCWLCCGSLWGQCFRAGAEVQGCCKDFDGKDRYCILAAESEAKINYAMSVKDGLYQLAKQMTEAANSRRKSKSHDIMPTADEFLSGFWKKDGLLPVVTVVIYFGAEEWGKHQKSEDENIFLDIVPEIPYHKIILILYPKL